MRTIEKTVYTIEELTETAKEKAFEEWGDNDGYSWWDDNRQTLTAFENIFPVKVRDFEYGYRKNIDFEFTADDDLENLKGERLATYIINNYKRHIYKGKYYSKSKYVDGKFINKFRYSKIFFEESYVLTGYCIDDDIMKPIYDFLKKPDESVYFRDLMELCLHSFITACQSDYEYSTSIDAFYEDSIANGWEYEADGTLI